MELLLFPTILLALTHGLTTAKTLAPNPDKITNGTRRIVLEGDEEVSFISVGDWGSCTVLYCTVLYCTVLYCTVL